MLTLQDVVTRHGDEPQRSTMRQAGRQGDLITRGSFLTIH